MRRFRHWSPFWFVGSLVTAVVFGACNQLLGNLPPEGHLGGLGGDGGNQAGGLGGDDNVGDGGLGGKPSQGDGGQGDGGMDGNGGSTGGVAGGDAIPPSVVSASPEGTLLDGRTMVVVEFDEEIDATDGDLTVSLDGMAVWDGDIEVDGSALRFLPAEPFNEPGTYTVEVSETITDLSGNAFSGYAFDFRLEPGNGGEDNQRLDTAGVGDVSCPHLVSDDSGNVAVLFQKGDELFTRFYRAGVGWEDLLSLGSGTGGVVRMSSSGRLAVVYTANSGGEPHILVRTASSADPTWSAPTAVDEDSSNTIVTQSACSLREQDKNLAINDRGAIAVIWRSTGSTGSFAETWTHTVKPAGESFLPAVDEPNGEGDLEPDAMPGVAIDPDGNVMITFLRDDTGYSEIKTREFSGSSGNWLSLKTVTVGGAPPWLDVDASGNFVFSYHPYIEGYGNNFYVRVFPFLGSDPDPLFYDDSAPQPFVQTRGNTWVVWSSGFGLRTNAGAAWDMRDDVVEVGALPVLVDLEPTANARNRALVAWEDDGKLEWALVNETNEDVLIDIDPEAGPFVLPTLGTAAREVRLVYDSSSRHGVAVWLEELAGETVLTTSQFFMQPDQP